MPQFGPRGRLRVLAKISITLLLALTMLASGIPNIPGVTGLEPAIAGGPDYVVNQTGNQADVQLNDDCDVNTGTPGSQCTLRAAITESNATSGAQVIHFAIPNTGPHLISPATELPTITGPVEINGYSQSGSQMATEGTPATPMIHIAPANSTAMNGLVIATNGVQISGLIITGFDQSGKAGIRLNTPVGAGDANTIVGNFIGLDGLGTTDQGNAFGVYIAGPNTQLGAADAANRNVISGNGTGVRINGTPALDNYVWNNFIGTTTSGTGSDPNTSDGVRIEAGATKNWIGEYDFGKGNVIANNGGDGVRIIDGSGSANTTGNSVRYNFIHDNGGLGIDLEGSGGASDGVTPNDIGDGDDGGNNLLNAPELTARIDDADPVDNVQWTYIQGVVKGVPGRTYELDVYTSPTCDSPSNRGEGATPVTPEYLNTQATADSEGNASFAFYVDDVPNSNVLTGAAVDVTSGADPDTSEFSNCIGGNSASTRNLTLTKTGDGAGRITATPGPSCSTFCSQDYNPGTQVTLIAQPTGVHPFLGWTGGGCTGTGACVVTMDATKAVSAHFDDPPPPPNLSVADCDVVETDSGNVSCTFNVSLGASTFQTVGFHYTTTNIEALAGKDYVATSGNASIPANETSTQINVPVKGDTEREIELEHFSLTLSQLSNASPGDLTGSGEIEDNDPLFNLFDANANGMSWENSLLSDLLSYYTYHETVEPAGPSWQEFLDAFDAKVGPLGLTRVGDFDESVLDPEDIAPSFDSFDTQGVMVENADTFIAAFRGTETDTWDNQLQDLITDFTLKQISPPGVTGKVHKGFWRALVESPAYGIVKSKAQDAVADGKKIWMTGHSLGGALATLCAYRLEKQGIPVKGVITMGSPRVGNPAFANDFNSMFGASSTRWVDEDDLVSQVPPSLPSTLGPVLDYKHVGRLNYITPVGVETLKSDSSVALNTTEPNKILELSLDDHDAVLYGWRMYENMDDPPRDATLQQRVGEFPFDNDPAIGTGLAPDEAARFFRNWLYEAKTVADLLLSMAADAAAQILEDLLYTANNIADALKAKFDRSATQVIQILNDLGIPATEIAGALKSIYNKGAEEVAVLLKTAGFLADHVVDALKAKFSATADKAIEWLKHAGFKLEDILVSVSQKFLLTVDATIGKMLPFGYKAWDFAQALKDKLGDNAEAATNRLRKWFEASAVMKALKDVYAQTALLAAELLDNFYDAVEIAQALKDRFLSSSGQAAQILKDIGMSATNVAEAMKEVFSKSAEQVADILHDLGYPVVQFVIALKSKFSTTASKTIELLLRVGIKAEDWLEVMMDKFSISVSVVIGKGKALGVKAWDFAVALKDKLGDTATKATERLAEWFAGNLVMRALRDVYDQEAQAAAELLDNFFNATEIGQALKENFALGSLATAQILKNIGFGAISIAKAVKSVFNKTAQQTGQILQDIGYGLNKVVDGVFNAFNLARQNFIDILKNLGYGIVDILAAIASLVF